uniref:Uncharacterized protein n=1 Tax=Arundo donax TaxID=35708 RepID=A0A0A9EXH0_ARUDO
MHYLGVLMWIPIFQKPINKQIFLEATKVACEHISVEQNVCMMCPFKLRLLYLIGGTV